MPVQKAAARTQATVPTAHSVADVVDVSHMSGILTVFSSLSALLSGPQVALVVKNPPANAGDVRDKDSIPGLGRSNMETHFRIFAWRIPQAEESGRL